MPNAIEAFKRVPEEADTSLRNVEARAHAYQETTRRSKNRFKNKERNPPKTMNLLSINDTFPSIQKLTHGASSMPHFSARRFSPSSNPTLSFSEYHYRCFIIYHY